MAKSKKTRKQPVRDLLDKIDYEGGAFEAFVNYGLSIDQYDIDEEDAYQIQEALVYLREGNQRLQRVLKRLEATAREDER